MFFSIIIPCAKKDQRYIRRCLLSLQDQDYNGWEAIVVYDGFDGGNVIDDMRITYLKTNMKKGASHVRNYGAKKAKGDTFLFFDADCVLFPGVLTLIADTFERNECDFVYGGYRFNHSTLSVYPSRPFDPYLLKCMNYICTMSPMKKEVFEKVGGFNEDLPYFQDWDFWLRAVKNGAKGHYIRDFLFQTEVPNAKSISGGLNYKWREKVLRLESLHNLPSMDVCVTTLSAPYQSIERAKALGARYLGSHNGSNLVQTPAQFNFGARAVIVQGFFPMNVEDHMALFPEGCIKAINWIGTDVWQLRNKFSHESLKIFKERWLSQIDIQMCNSEILQEELAEIGIKADVVYQPITESIDVTPLPKVPTVSAYFSKGHPLHNEFYYRDLAQSMPDVNFIFFGTGLRDTQEGNIRFMGWVPINEAVKMTTLHLRLTAHDGFPHTPVYMLLGGRRVLCNFPLKFADYVPDVPSEASWESLKTKVVAHIRSHLDGKLDYKVEDCRDYYNELCDPIKYKRIVMEKINNFGKEKKSEEAKNIVCPSNV
jgi:glycosyltransferase involved in cell wall biosynthesis